MQTLLTTKQVAEMFQVSERTITQKFIPEGLKYIPVGKKDYRFKESDIEEFIETRKQIAQQSIELTPIKRKAKSRQLVSIDFQKRQYNREFNKVI